MLEGRQAELAGLRGSVDRATAGAGGTWWLLGEAGVGKTALLDELIALVPDGVRVLRVTGRESEAELTWAGLGTLLAPLVGEGHTDRLPAVQRSAVRAALALEVPVGPLEPYAVFLGAHGTITAAASSQPVLIVVDDVQWLDEPSLLAVEYLASRWKDDAVAMVVTGRPDDDRKAPVLVTAVGPVGPEAAAAILADHGVSDDRVRHRIHDELGGNPLLLVAAAAALDEDERRGAGPLPAVLPVPPSVMRLAEQKVAEEEAATRTALLVVAIAPGGQLAVVTHALLELGVGLDGLEQAERAGLLVVEDGEARFTHPTIRAFAYHGAPAGERRAAHRAVAVGLADPVARAWHRGLGTLGQDEDVAVALERAAADLHLRGAPMVAARNLEMAARLSPGRDEAARRLRQAAEAVVEQGDDGVAEALLDRADATGGDRIEDVTRRRLRFRLALRAGAIGGPIAGLRALADEVAEDHPGLSAEILLDVMAPLVRTVRPVELLETAEAARERASVAGDDRVVLRAEVAAGVGKVATGDAEGHAQLGRYGEILAAEGAQTAGVFLAEVVAPCLALLQHTLEAEELFATLEGDLRAQSAVPVLIAVLSAQAIATHGSDLARAAGLGQEAIALADEIGRPSLALLAASSLVIAAGVIGDRERCLAAAERLLATDEPGLRQAALAGVGALQLGHGALDEALATYEQLADEIGIGEGVVRWEPEWCETLVRARRPEEAAEVLAAATGGNQAVTATGAFARVGGLLAADIGDAAGCFESAVGFFQLVGNRVGEGRTELVWGERLRRARRRAAAREHLERAVELLRGVGATVWAERAERELGAAAGRSVTAVVGIEALTGQEAKMARLAASGATNREIGEQMFLSPRTVETHLGAVFRKLGIRNRRELSALAVEEPRLRD